jgi:hypothetical protein
MAGPSWAVVVFGSAFRDAVVIAETDANNVGTSLSRGYKFERSADLGIAQGRRHADGIVTQKYSRIEEWLIIQ